MRDFEMVRIVYRPASTPIFPIVNTFWSYCAQALIIPHFVFVAGLVDLISYPIRRAARPSGCGRLAILYQFAPRKEGGELIHELALPVTLDGIRSTLAVNVVMPGDRSINAQQLDALHALLQGGDGTAFLRLASSHTPHQFLEPIDAGPDADEEVKAALLSLQPSAPAMEAERPSSGNQEWAHVILQFRGQPSRFLIHQQFSSWFWYNCVRYPIPLSFPIFFICSIIVLGMCDLLLLLILGPVWLCLGRAAVPIWDDTSADPASANKIELFLITKDQGGEYIETKVECYRTVLCENYTGPSYSAGFNALCRGSYTRWAQREVLRTLDAPQEARLYTLRGMYEALITSEERISKEEMKRRVADLKLPCCGMGCCC